MAFDLNNFMANGLPYGGARPSKFDVQVNVPASLNGILDPNTPQKLNFTIKAATIPAFALGVTPIPYFGRVIKSSGDRVWDDWRVTVMLDEDYSTRAFFEAWNNSINSLVSNYMTTSEDNTDTPDVINFVNENYKSDWTISQYGKDRTLIRQYNLVGAWPRALGDIQLDWEATNRIIQFNVIVSFDTMFPTVEGVHGDASIYGQSI